MKLSRQTVRTAWIVVGVGIFLFLTVAIWRPFEPRSQGKCLSQWAAILAQPWGDADDPSLPREREQAAAAIREIGPSAAPYALQWCAKTDSALKKKLLKWTYRQSVIDLQIPRADQYQARGIEIFRALGPAAKPAIPSLIGLLGEKHPAVALTASGALSAIGPDTIPFLIQALTNASGRVRAGAATALGGYRSQAKAAVPALIQCLEDVDLQTRAVAVNALGLIQDETDLVVPALLRCLEDADAYVGEGAALALGRIHQQPDLVIPALLQRMERETNMLVVSKMFFSIRPFGTNAQPWSPVMAGMIESNRLGPFTPSALTMLQEIDPETAKPLIRQQEFLLTNNPPDALAPQPFNPYSR